MKETIETNHGRFLEKPIIREEYGLENNSAKSIYRTVERIGEHSDEIVKF